MIELLESNYKKILLSSVITTSIAITLSYVLKSNFVLFSILGLVAAFITYGVARKNMDESEVESSFKYLIISIIAGIFGLVHHLLYRTIYKKVISLSQEGDMFSKMYESTANSTFMLSLLANVGVVFILFIYLKDEARKEKFNLLKDISFKKLDKNEMELNDVEPDIVLCKDAETGKPVIWPHSDRYTHMLCLGPTGSGKTSQTIIPLIYQDIQKKNVGITVLEPKGAIFA